MGLIEAPVNFLSEDMDFSSRGNKLEEYLYMILTHLYTFLYTIFVVIPFQYGASYLYLKSARGEKFEMRAIVMPYTRIVDVLISEILVIGIVLAGFIMFIIPGIFFLIRLSFVPYLVMDKGLNAMGAVKESWKMTADYGWTILGMAFLAIFIFIGGVLFFIVGAFVSVIWIQTAFASLYYAVDSRMPEGNNR